MSCPLPLEQQTRGVVNSLLSNVRMRLMRAHECRQRTSFFRFDALGFQQCRPKTHANETIFISRRSNGNAAWNMKRLETRVVFVKMF